MVKRSLLLTFFVILMPALTARAAAMLKDTRPEIMEICQSQLTLSERETDEELLIKIDGSVAKKMFESTPKEQRLSRENIQALKSGLVNQSLADQLEIVRAYVALTLRQFSFVPAPDFLAKSLTIVFFSHQSIEDLFGERFDGHTHEEFLAVASINSLKSNGVKFDLVKGSFTIDPQIYQDFEDNVRSFLNKNDFVREDWKLGTAMDYPQSGWRFWRKAPSEFAKLKILNRNGKAYFAMKVYNPDTEKFEEHEYPVISLSKNGNPVLLIHPRSHILIPTQTRVEKSEKYERRNALINRFTSRRPVPVDIYYGIRHLGLFEQLVLTVDGHHRTYSAWKKRQPLRVEITGASDYYHFSVTWRTIRTTY